METAAVAEWSKIPANSLHSVESVNSCEVESCLDSLNSDC